MTSTTSTTKSIKYNNNNNNKNNNSALYNTIIDLDHSDSSSNNNNNNNDNNIINSINDNTSINDEPSITTPSTPITLTTRPATNTSTNTVDETNNNNTNTNTNDSTNTTKNQLPFNLEVTLSRKYYRVGGTIVGTVRITPLSLVSSSNSSTTQTQHVKTTTTINDIRTNILSSIQLFAVGYCKYDCRWHKNTDHYIQFDKNQQCNMIHNSVPDDLPIPSFFTNTTNTTNTNKDKDTKNTSTADNDTDATTIPIWVSNPILNLLTIPERSYGSWNESKPQSINIQRFYSNNDDNNEDFAEEMQSNTTADTISLESQSQSVYKNIQLEKEQLVYTFRIGIPDTVPPTLLCVSCRYFYSIVLRIQLKDNNTTTPFWIHLPVTVLSKQHINNNNSITSNTHTNDNDNDTNANPATSYGMAHSSGLSYYLSADEIHLLDDGQYTVNRSGAALYRHLNTNPSSTNSNNIQSMTIIDPISKKHVCILTLIGTTILRPGSRMVLKFDFPSTTYRPMLKSHCNYTIFKNLEQEKQNEKGDTNDTNNSCNVNDWLYCYQISCCIQGEEIAIRCSDNTKVCCKKYLFATDYSIIDPYCTECISFNNLILPLSTPCTIQTDAVDITIKCIIDISISTELPYINNTSTSTNTSITPTTIPNPNIKYRNLHLEIPCQVIHPTTAYESNVDNNDNETNEVAGRGDDSISLNDNSNRDLFDQIRTIPIPIDTDDDDTIDDIHKKNNNKANIVDTDSNNINQYYNTTTTTTNSSNKFPSNGIVEDLKVLSLSMADRCSLLPKPHN